MYHENYSYECAYIFIGDIWGLGRSKLAQIVNAKDDCPLSDKLIDDFNALTEDAQTKVADYVIDRASSRALRDELRRREGY